MILCIQPTRTELQNCIHIPSKVLVWQAQPLRTREKGSGETRALNLSQARNLGLANQIAMMASCDITKL